MALMLPVKNHTSIRILKSDLISPIRRTIRGHDHLELALRIIQRQGVLNFGSEILLLVMCRDNYRHLWREIVPPHWTWKDSTEQKHQKRISYIGIDIQNNERG